MQRILELDRPRNTLRLLWRTLVVALLVACTGDDPVDTGALVEAVEVTPATATLRADEQVAFEATVQGDDLDDDSVTWSLQDAASSDALTAEGVFTAGATDEPRTVLVVATSNADDRVRGTASVGVEPDPAVLSVAVSPVEPSVAAGDSVAFEASVEGTWLDDTSVTWSLEGAADDDQIAADGTFTAGAAAIDDRVVTVVATSGVDSSVSGTATVTVEAGTPLVESVTVDPASTTVDAGATVAFTAQVSGVFLSDTSVTWSLEDAALGDAIDSSGSFTAGLALSAARDVTVVATSAADSDLSGSATVSVTPVDTAEGGVLYVDDDSPQDDDLGPLGSQANPYADLHAAVDAAATGDTVVVAPGTYDLGGERLDGFPEGMTLQGAGSDQVVIDASRNTVYGLHIDAVDDLTLAGFTLEGPQDSNPADWTEIRDDYGLKTSPPVNNLVLRDVTVQNSHLTEIDLNGVIDAQLIDVTALGNLHRDAGVGISVVGVDGVTFENVTTGDNAWGGLGIFSGSYAGTPNVEGIDLDIDASNDFADGIYIDDEYTDGDLVDFTDNEFAIEGLSWMVTNSSFRDDGRSDDFVLFARDAEQAQSIVDGFPLDSVADTTIRSVVLDANGHLQPGNDFLVLAGMDIQQAIDLADEGAFIEVAAGEFLGGLVIDKPLTLMGAGLAQTHLRGPATLAGIQVLGESAPVSGVELIGFSSSGYSRGVYVKGEVSDLVIDRCSLSANGNAGLWIHRGEVAGGVGTQVTGLTIADSHFDDNGKYGIDFELGSSSPPTDNHLEDVEVYRSTFHRNGEKGIYLEALSHALFEDVEVRRSGITDDRKWNAGIDINLKYGDYEDITLRRVTVLDSGWAEDGQTDPLFNVAVTLKARDDGAAYGADPATLDDVLVEDSWFSGPENGLRLGEPGKLNATPTNVVVEDTVLEGFGSRLGGAYALIVSSEADVTATTGNSFNGLTGADAESEVYDADDDDTLGDAVLVP